MVSSTKIDRTEKLGITLPISLLQKIENKRGDIPRSKYIRRAVENYPSESVMNLCLAFLKGII
jgi:metal-responsive CopG/Arc/MetJ family transcriptional regulator